MAKLTPVVAAKIDELRAGGASKSAMLRALAAAGTPLNWRTLSKYLDRSEPSPAADGALSAATTGALEQRAAAALEGDDLARLARVRDDLDVALATWRPLLGRDGSAVRAYATLARIHADVTARLVELRPRPESEHDRLTALGEQARGELLARACGDDVAALKEQLAFKQGVVDRLLEDLPDHGGET